MTTPGVIRIVSYGGVPRPISDIEIASIRLLTDSGVFADAWPYVAIGERVCIQSGPLEGVEGILVRVKNVHRLVVSIHVLRRSVAVELDSDSVSSLCSALEVVERLKESTQVAVAFL